MGEVFNIKNIPRGWILTSIDDIATIVMGQSPPSDTYNNEGIGLPFFQGKAEFTDLHPIVRKWCSKPNKIALPDDILISVRAPVGATNISNVECCIGRGLAAIRYAPCNKFLFYYLRLIEKKLDEKGTGTTFRAISGDVIRGTPVYLPPLEEQHRIVAKIEELFSNLDKGIERLKTAQQQLKIYRQSVLKWAFEGKLTDNRNIEWKKLGELCDGVEYGSAAKSKEEGEIPVIRMGNLQNGRIDWNDLVFTDDPEEIKKYELNKNDVLFNRTNSPEWVGKTAIYKGERPAIFAGYLIRIRYKKNILTPDYLNYYLNSQTAKNYGNSVKSFGVNQSNINGTKLKEYPFPFTSLIEQQRIVSEIEDRLSVYDKLEESIIQTLQQAEALRQSILKKAFEGKLISHDPKEEPANA